MKDYIIGSLKWALAGVDENDQNIFENYKVREEVKCDVSNIKQNEKEEGNSTNNVEGEELSGYINNDESRANTRAERPSVEFQSGQTEIVEEFRRDRRLAILTNTGKRFVNTILDHCVCKKAINLNLTGDYTIDQFEYPDIKLFKIVNLSRRSYYTNDAELFDNNGERMILKYPFLPEYDNDVDWEYIDGEAEVMDPDEFKRTWTRIIRVSKRLDDSLSVNKKLNKPIVHWSEISCAYNVKEKLTVRFDKQASKDDLMLTYITQPYWKIDDEAFAKEERESNYSNLDVYEWIMSKDGSNNSNKSNGNRNNKQSRQQNVSRNQKKNNRSKGNVNQQSQSEEDSNANTLN